MGMQIDGISSSSHLDSSGEILSIEGHDISDLEEGRGVFNWEHNSDSPEDILGKVTFAKKIFSEKDCDDDRQSMYWNVCKMPFVYIKGELMDDEMHPGAVAAAALIRYYARRGEKILAGFSIEGQTLERKDNILERSVGRRVAITLRPCNKSCISGLLDDPAARTVIEKSEGKRPDSSLYQVDSVVVADDGEYADVLEDLLKSVRILRKTLTAGGGNVAPSALTGGAALAREHIASRVDTSRMKAKYRDWPRTRPLKEWLKAELPDISEEYVDHFAQIADDVSLRKGLPKLKRIGAQHSPHASADQDQKSLIEGIYLDPSAKYDPGHNLHQGRILHLKNDSGQDVLVKKHGFGRHPQAQDASDYYSMAKNVFDMGHHVPVTNYFKHGGDTYQAISKLENHASPLTHAVDDKVQAAAGTGDAHKLSVLDFVLGADMDRHDGNVMVSPEGTLKHIDNDGAFDYRTEEWSKPHSIYNGLEGFLDMPMHKDARSWASKLDPDRLAFAMRSAGRSHDDTINAVNRLKWVRQAASQSLPMRQVLSPTGALPVHDLKEEE